MRKQRWEILTLPIDAREILTVEQDEALHYMLDNNLGWYPGATEDLLCILRNALHELKDE